MKSEVHTTGRDNDTGEEQPFPMVQNAGGTVFERLISPEQELTFDYAAKVFESKGLTLDGNQMGALHLAEGGRFTNLALLLSDQFDMPIKVAVYRDESRSVFLDRAVIGGCVLEQVDSAVEFIHRFNRCSSTIGRLERIDHYAYPVPVIREAVLNAVIHRDYGNPATTLISVFPDRMTIVSPGSLNSEFSEEELFLGVSSLRNRYLADVMYLLGFTGSCGSGLPRIRRAYLPSRSSPSVLVGQATFTLILPAQDAGGTSEVRDYVDAHMEFTRHEMQAAFGMSKTDATRTINCLLDDGTISRIGQGRSVKYRRNLGI